MIWIDGERQFTDLAAASEANISLKRNRRGKARLVAPLLWKHEYFQVYRLIN